MATRSSLVNPRPNIAFNTFRRNGNCRGVHRRLDGSTTRKTSDCVIDLLRTAYGDEMETTLNYQTSAIVLGGVRAEETERSLQKTLKTSSKGMRARR